MVDVTHPDLANVPKADLREKIAKKYKCREKCVVLFGFRTKYGGMRSTGYCLIYDTFDLLKKYEPRHRKFSVKIWHILLIFCRWDLRNLRRQESKEVRERLRKPIERKVNIRERRRLEVKMRIDPLYKYG